MIHLKSLNLRYLTAPRLFLSVSDSREINRFIFKLVKDTVKIPLEMITTQYYSETGYRFGKHVTAFYISIEE